MVVGGQVYGIGVAPLLSAQKLRPRAVPSDHFPRHFGSYGQVRAALVSDRLGPGEAIGNQQFSAEQKLLFAGDMTPLDLCRVQAQISVRGRPI